jgi:membrane protease YdiL (CAAX protease family)
MVAVPTYDSMTIPYLLLVLVWMPLVGVLSYLRLKSGKPIPPKTRRYRAMVLLQVFLLGYSLLVARQNRIRLFGEVSSVWAWVIAALYLAVIARRLNAAWKRLSPERKKRARVLLPESPYEMRYWIPIAVLAGLSEECAFRGTAYVALRAIIGSTTFAITACVLAFAMAHMMQGWRGVLGTGVIAIVMHAIVSLTAGLYLVVAVHAVYDLIVGVIAMRAFQRDSMVSGMEPQPVS